MNIYNTTTFPTMGKLFFYWEKCVKMMLIILIVFIFIYLSVTIILACLL
jgi:hypothetical protein